MGLVAYAVWQYIPQKIPGIYCLLEPSTRTPIILWFGGQNSSERSVKTKPRLRFPNYIILYTGWLMGIPISWLMNQSLYSWLAFHPLQNSKSRRFWSLLIWDMRSIWANSTNLTEIKSKTLGLEDRFLFGARPPDKCYVRFVERRWLGIILSGQSPPTPNSSVRQR